MGRCWVLPGRAARAAAWGAAVALASTSASADDTEASAPAVSVRADPGKDGRVLALLGQQTTAAREVAAAQFDNVQARLQTLRANDAACRRAPPLAPPADRAPDPGNRPLPLEVEPARPVVSRVSLPLVTCDAGGLATTWTAGSLDMDSGAARPGADGFALRTRGVMFGADRGWNDWAAGVGFGLAHRVADSSTDATSNAADAASASAYIAYRPAKGAFVDAVLGRGLVEMRSARRVDSRGRVAASRGASESYSAVAAGYRLALGPATLAPYTRLETVRATLNRYADADASDALRYEAQSLPSLKAALGIEGSARIPMLFGHVSPRAKVEWRRELERAGPSSVAYVDDPDAPALSIDASTAARDLLSLGFGATVQLRDNWSFDAGYAWDGSTNGSGGLGRVAFTLSWRAR